MNRRKFIQQVGVSVAAVPLGYGLAKHLSAPEATRWEEGLTSAPALPLTDEETRLKSLLSKFHPEIYYHGGPVVSKLSGEMNPTWVNVLIPDAPLKELKNALFQFGVRPISSWPLPEQYIRFTYGDVLCNLLVMHPGDFCEQNRFLSARGGVPFAHQFVVYDVNHQRIYDPYESAKGRLVGRGAKAKRIYSVDMIQTPNDLLSAMDYYLGAQFEGGYLKLAEGVVVKELEEWLTTQTAPADLRRNVVERFINYFPDLVQLRGYSMVSHFLTSPLISDALAQELDLDAQALHRELVGHSEVNDLQVLKTLNKVLGYRLTDDSFFKNVDHFLMANSFTFRRLDLVGQLIEA